MLPPRYLFDWLLIVFLFQADSAAGSALLGVLGVVVEGITGQIGLQCSPISAIGVASGNSCSSNAVCCQNNNVVRFLPYTHPVPLLITRMHRVASSPLAASPSLSKGVFSVVLD